MSVKITADSAADFTKEQIERYGIEVLPLSVSLGDQSYVDCVTAYPADIFKFVDAGGPLPKTSAVSVQDFHDAFARLSPLHEAVINVDIASPLSACYQNACIAAKDFDNVYVIDSKALSAGEALLCVLGSEAAESGKSGKEVYEYMKSTVSRIETTFIVDRLDYLAKGGRCSALTAFGANLLKIKPSIIQDKEGNLNVGKKYRGTFTKALCDYARDILSGRNDLDLSHCFVVHPAAPAESVAAVMDEIRSLAPFEEVVEIRTGCTVASHCGPATVGVMFAHK